MHLQAKEHQALLEPTRSQEEARNDPPRACRESTALPATGFWTFSILELRQNKVRLFVLLSLLLRFSIPRQWRPLQHSCWKIPWTEEPGGLQSMGSLGVRHDWATSLSLFTLMHWRRKWQPTPVFLPGESQGWGSLVGCCLWGYTELDMTEVTQQQQETYNTPSLFLKILLIKRYNGINIKLEALSFWVLEILLKTRLFKVETNDKLTWPAKHLPEEMRRYFPMPGDRCSV